MVGRGGQGLFARLGLRCHLFLGGGVGEVACARGRPALAGCADGESGDKMIDRVLFPWLVLRVGCTNSIFLQSAGFHVAGEISVARVGSSRITERLIVATLAVASPPSVRLKWPLCGAAGAP